MSWPVVDNKAGRQRTNAQKVFTGQPFILIINSFSIPDIKLKNIIDKTFVQEKFTKRCARTLYKMMCKKTLQNNSQKMCKKSLQNDVQKHCARTIYKTMCKNIVLTRKSRKSFPRLEKVAKQASSNIFWKNSDGNKKKWKKPFQIFFSLQEKVVCKCKKWESV